MILRLVSAAALFLIACLPAQAFETRATAAWVYDVTTHTVLMDKNGEASLPPASMSKLMTVNMLFEALKDGRVTHGHHLWRLGPCGQLHRSRVARRCICNRATARRWRI